jgi:hypothetical protein
MSEVHWLRVYRQRIISNEYYKRQRECLSKYDREILGGHFLLEGTQEADKLKSYCLLT